MVDLNPIKRNPSVNAADLGKASGPSNVVPPQVEEQTSPNANPTARILQAARKFGNGLLSEDAIGLLGKIAAQKTVGGVKDDKGASLDEKA